MKSNANSLFYNIRQIIIIILIFMTLAILINIFIGSNDFKGYSDALFYSGGLALIICSISMFKKNKALRENREEKDEDVIDKKTSEFGIKMFVASMVLFLMSRYVYYL